METVFGLSFPVAWVLAGVLASSLLGATARLNGHVYTTEKWPVYFLTVCLCLFGGMLAAIVGVILALVAVIGYSGILSDD